MPIKKVLAGWVLLFISCHSFEEYSISQETQVSLLASPSNVSESKEGPQESPCGLGSLVFISWHSPVESRLSLRARNLVILSGADRRLEQVLAMSARGMV